VDGVKAIVAVLESREPMSIGRDPNEGRVPFRRASQAHVARRMAMEVELPRRIQRVPEGDIQPAILYDESAPL